MLSSSRQKAGCAGRHVAFLLLCASGVAAEPVAVTGPALDRLAKVARLWGDVRYLHPFLVSREVDWDRAFVDAVPQLLAARDSGEYRRAVEAMLAPLRDPVTRVVPVPAPNPAPDTPSTGDPPALLRWVEKEGEILVVDLGRHLEAGGYSAIWRVSEPLGPALASATAVIFDLRPHAPLGPENETPWLVSAALERLAPSLVSRACQGPGSRLLLHSGYSPQSGSTSGGYFSSWVTPLPRAYAPGAGVRIPSRVVFVVPGDAPVPDLVLALQRASAAAIVSHGPLAPDKAVLTQSVEIGERLRVQLRVSELTTGAPAADKEVPAGDASAALAAALALARGEVPPAAARPGGSPDLPEGSWRPDATYPTMLEPELPYRLLAVVRLWNVIRLFYPYLELIGDWDAVLPEFLARMEKAPSGRDYALAVREMAMRVQDSHTWVSGHPELDAAHGAGPLGTVPIVVRRVEGQAVVTARSTEAASAGVEVGDILLAVDDQPLEERLQALRPFHTASTASGLANTLLAATLRGPVSSPARLLLRGAADRPKQVSLPRQSRWRSPEREGEVLRMASATVGYADLARLEVGQVEEMFRRFRDAQAIVFDMRGYPRGTAWAIAPHINTRGAKYGALFSRSQVSAMSSEEAAARLAFSQPLPEKAGVELYRGQTLMLIDDRAISQSEHTGLFFEAANGTIFVGSASSGANGDVTSTTLPGGISVGFTGHDVRHADGRQLQRLGLQPDVPIEPTIAGLRAGRDEVLERALAYVTQGR